MCQVTGEKHPPIPLSLHAYGLQCNDMKELADIMLTSAVSKANLGLHHMSQMCDTKRFTALQQALLTIQPAPKHGLADNGLCAQPNTTMYKASRLRRLLLAFPNGMDVRPQAPGDKCP